jgi:two-component system LytT family response regulator
MSDIKYCQACGNYTKFFLSNGDTYMSSKNLGDYEHPPLDGSHFFRVRNSYIVNMRFVARIDKRDGKCCELDNGMFIPNFKSKIRRI